MKVNPIFSSKGFSFDVEKVNGGGSYYVAGYQRLILNYIEIPITAAYEINQRLEISAGSYFAIGINGRYEMKIKYENVNGGITRIYDARYFGFRTKDEIIDYSNTAALQKFDYGVLLDLSYNIGIGSVNIFFSNGLRDIKIKDYWTNFSQDEKKRNNIALGFSFTYFLLKNKSSCC